jgi:4-amino-4-deoxy-L-arabinose transferase-like glycosyltransferase
MVVAAMCADRTFSVSLVFVLAILAWRLTTITGPFTDNDAANYAIYAHYYIGRLFSGLPPYFGLDSWAKPGWIPLSMAAVGLFGYDDMALARFNAVVAAANALLAYRIAVQLSADGRAGLIAALLTSVSATLWDIDASGMPHTSATLALLLAVTVYLKARAAPGPGLDSLRLSGICAGYAAIIHPLMAIYLPVLYALCIADMVRKRLHHLRGWLATTFTLGLYFAAPVMIADGLYRIIFAIEPRMALPRVPGVCDAFGLGFLSDAVCHLFDSQAANPIPRPFVMDIVNLAATPSAVAVEGWIIVAGMAIAAHLAWHGRRTPLRDVMLIAWLPPLLWTMHASNIRLWHGSIVLLFIFAAIALAHLARRAPRPRFLIAAPAAAAALLAAQPPPAPIAMEYAFPGKAFAQARIDGISQLVVYLTGFYGGNWNYYLARHFGDSDFGSAEAGPTCPDCTPAIRMRHLQTLADLEAAITAGRADIVVARLRPTETDNPAALAKAAELKDFAERHGFIRLQQFGGFHPLPPTYFVYDTRQADRAAIAR